MKITVLIVGATVALSGCGALSGLSSGVSSPFSGGGSALRGSLTEIGGIRFRTRVSAVTEDRRGFSTATRDAGRSIEAAAEAGRVQAVEYCIRRFGGSGIVWSVGPDRPPEQVALGEGGTLVMAGTCVTR